MRLGLFLFLSLILAALFTGVVGVFLVYVPAQTVFAAATMVLGLILMYLLGLITGRRWRRLSPTLHRIAPARPRDWSTAR